MTDTETPERLVVAVRDGGVEARPWVESRPSCRRLIPRYHLRELWAYRDVGLILAERDLKVRYKQTFFGVTWALLQPLIAMLLFTLVLGSQGADLPSDGLPYAAFVVCGLAVWFPFQSALTAAADSLTQNPELVTKVYFPRLLAPLGAILAPLADLTIATIVALVVAIVSGVSIPATAPLVLVGGVWFIAIALGYGTLLSALNLLYRDVRYAIGFISQLLFFVSPVVYPSSLTDGLAQKILAINPLVGLIDFFRWSLLGIEANTETMLISLGGTLVLLAVGLWFFQNMERRFADRI